MKDDYLSSSKTNTLRGILCVLIIIHHIYQYRFREYVNPYIGEIFQNLGFWCVALFLFLSGYALTYSLKNKKDYMSGFVRHKVTPIIISYIVFLAIRLFSCE